MSQLNSVLDAIDEGQSSALDRLFELLRIESISTEPAYKTNCADAADWLSKQLNEIGFEAKVCPTDGHPMVLGHFKAADNAPHVLFYGHYDVQPVDPLELWEQSPFDPKIIKREDGSSEIYGRGAADDKGQLMTFVEACRAWISQTGSLPCNVTIMFEGEEESGSPSMIPFLREYKQELTADIALVCDTSMWDRNTPAIATALRGMIGEELTIKAANRDLHSGLYGSAAANPIHILTKILSDLRDEDGRILLDGFYDAVPETPDEIMAQWSELGFSDREFLGDVGLSVPAGEKGRSVMEQTWVRPTAEINGIWGGYNGDGFKTVIPSLAHAKVSFRLVGQQDPDIIREAFRKFVEARLPKDCSVTFQERGGSPAVHLDYNMPELQKAANALTDEWSRDTALIAMGGSIPVVGDFKTELGMDSLLIGFGLADDRIHSPNEKYELTSFQKGARSWARILLALAEG